MGEKLKEIIVEQYGLGTSEMIAAAAVKAYLMSLPERDAVEKLDGVMQAKIIRICHESGVPLPVQSLVEGAKLAAFIDEAVADSIGKMEDREDDMSQVVAAVLKNIDGKHVVETMSIEVIQFIADVYRCLKY